MAQIDISLHGDGCWPDIQQRPRIDLMGNDAPPIRLALLAGGMKSGKSSVSLRLDLPDGSVVLTECSLKLFFQSAVLLLHTVPREEQESLLRGEIDARLGSG